MQIWHTLVLGSLSLTRTNKIRRYREFQETPSYAVSDVLSHFTSTLQECLFFYATLKPSKKKIIFNHQSLVDSNHELLIHYIPPQAPSS